MTRVVGNLHLAIFWAGRPIRAGGSQSLLQLPHVSFKGVEPFAYNSTATSL
jgi:hypothetical protein